VPQKQSPFGQETQLYVEQVPPEVQPDPNVGSWVPTGVRGSHNTDVDVKVDVGSYVVVVVVEGDMDRVSKENIEVNGAGRELKFLDEDIVVAAWDDKGVVTDEIEEGR
jgi:hypothetical protein